MQSDKFSTDYFFVSYHGIDIIKNGLTKKHIDFSEIKSIEVKKARSIKNWPIVSFLGTAISLFFLQLIIIKTPQFNLSEVAYVRSALLVYISLYILFLAGLFLIIISNVRTVVIKIIQNNKQTYLFPLTKLKKNQRLVPFINFLSSRVNTQISLPIIENA